MVVVATLQPKQPWKVTTTLSAQVYLHVYSSSGVLTLRGRPKVVVQHGASVGVCHRKQPNSGRYRAYAASRSTVLPVLPVKIGRRTRSSSPTGGCVQDFSINIALPTLTPPNVCSTKAVCAVRAPEIQVSAPKGWLEGHRVEQIGDASGRHG